MAEAVQHFTWRIHCGGAGAREALLLGSDRLGLPHGDHGVRAGRGEPRQAQPALAMKHLCMGIHHWRRSTQLGALFRPWRDSLEMPGGPCGMWSRRGVSREVLPVGGPMWPRGPCPVNTRTGIARQILAGGWGCPVSYLGGIPREGLLEGGSGQEGVGQRVCPQDLPVGSLVCAQCRLALEALGAAGAGVGALLRVGALVCCEVALLAEAPAAGGAGEGPLSRVDAPVGDQVGPLVEALPALGAGEGLLPGVDALVGDQVGPLAEALPTHVAGEGLLGLAVPALHGGLGLGSDEPLLHGMGALVGRQVGLLAEALPAAQAREGALARVHPLVG